MLKLKPAGLWNHRGEDNCVITVDSEECLEGSTQLAIVFCGYCKCLFFSLPPPDHKGPKAADHRRRDALNRLVHPHLLADCGSAQKDRGRVQPGGQSAVLSFGLPLFSPL